MKICKDIKDQSLKSQSLNTVLSLEDKIEKLFTPQLNGSNNAQIQNSNYTILKPIISINDALVNAWSTVKNILYKSEPHHHEFSKTIENENITFSGENDRQITKISEDNN